MAETKVYNVESPFVGDSRADSSHPFSRKPCGLAVTTSAVAVVLGLLQRSPPRILESRDPLKFSD